MTIRTSKSTVTFQRPFVLDGLDEVLPMGTYDVETDEELLEGVSFPAYRRISTLIHLPARPGHPGLMRTLTVEPNELDAALKRDRAPAEVPVGGDAIPKTPLAPTDSCRVEANGQAIQAIQRAEDEGMIVRPTRTTRSVIGNI